MNTNVQIAVLGGDGRYPWAVRELRDRGFSVRTCGVPGLPSEGSLREVLTGAGAVLLPMKPGETLTVGGETLELALLPDFLPSGAFAAAGSFPEDMEAWLGSRGLRCVSVLEDETYQWQNAALTAEAALGLAMEHMKLSLWGANVLVVGWGRIGKLLSLSLWKLGARVTATSRKEGNRAEMELLGLRPEITGVYQKGLGDYDLIFNTVPHCVFSEAQTRGFSETCVLVELASAPGGFPPGLEARVISGGGLPGRAVPETAGEILAEAVVRCLWGTGRVLE